MREGGGGAQGGGGGGSNWALPTAQPKGLPCGFHLQDEETEAQVFISFFELGQLRGGE